MKVLHALIKSVVIIFGLMTLFVACVAVYAFVACLLLMIISIIMRAPITLSMIAATGLTGLTVIVCGFILDRCLAFYPEFEDMLNE